MIKLVLQDFKCYRQQTTFSFPEAELIRIKGDSGIGKTTLFKAIQWVLYNHPNSKIYPSGVNPKQCKTVVELHLSANLIIIRTKNPIMLTLQIDDRIEQNEVAQATIINLFGTREIWSSCVYLAQEELCPLLSFSNNQRMEVLDNLSFLGNDPTATLEKIIAATAEVELTCKVEKEFFEKIQNDFESKFGSVLTSIALSEAEVASFTQELISIEQEFTSINLELASTKQKQELKSKLTTKLATVRKELTATPNLTTDHINSIELELDTLNEELLISKQYAEYNKCLANCTISQTKLKSLAKPDRIYTQQDYAKAVADWTKFNAQKALLAKYSITDIPARIEQIKCLLSRIEIWQKAISIKDQLKSLQSKKDKLEVLKTELVELNLFDKVFTQKDYETAIVHADKYQRQVKILNQYQLKEDQVEIRRNQLQTLLSGQSEAKLWQQVDLLKDKLTKFKRRESKIESKELEAARDELRNLERSTNIMKCPNCERNVRLYNDKLVLAERSPVPHEQVKTFKSRLAQLERDYTDGVERDKIEQNINTLISSFASTERVPLLNSIQYKEVEFELAQLDSITPLLAPINISANLIRKYLDYSRLSIEMDPVLNQIDLLNTQLSDLGDLSDLPLNIALFNQTKLTAELTTLTNHELITEPVLKPELISEYLRYIEEEIKLKSYQEELASYNFKSAVVPRNYSEVTKLIAEKKTILAKYHSLLPRRYQLLAEQSSLENQLNELVFTPITQLEKQLKELDCKRISLKERLDTNQVIIQRDQEQAKLLSARNKVDLLTKQLANLNKLLSLTRLEMATVLEEKIAGINDSLRNIVNKLFNDPITVELSLIKTTKTTKVSKPNVHLTILYKDSEYDSLEELSKGEAKRISMAMTLALNLLSSFPMILFDESLTGLHEELKETTLETIKQLTSKTVLCIMHEGVEGYYDKVISLS